MKRLWICIPLALAACDPTPLCDPGFYVEAGGCFPIASADAGGGDAAMTEDDAGSADAAACRPAPGMYDGFGDPCTSDADCGCYAPTCATAPLNYCSRIQCDPGEADDCPPDWVCQDISQYSMDPSVTHICMRL